MQTSPAQNDGVWEHVKIIRDTQQKGSKNVLNSPASYDPLARLECNTELNKCLSIASSFLWFN